MHPLHRLFIDKELFDETKSFLINHLKEVTVELAFDGKSTQGVELAKKAIENAFMQIKRDFSQKKESKINLSH